MTALSTEEPLLSCEEIFQRESKCSQGVDGNKDETKARKYYQQATG